MKLSEDERGLFIEADLDLNDPDVKKITSKMERGDLDEMSFHFMPTVEEWDDSGEMPLRRLKEVNLFDVAIVTYPAYNDTSIGIRSLEKFKEQKHSCDAVQARMRMKLALANKL